MNSAGIQAQETRPLIRSYGGGAFVISQQRYESSVLLFPTEASPWENAAADIQGILQVLERCKDADIEILLVGSGRQQIFIPPSQTRQWREHYRITVEMMDTGAACRTFNVLQAEDRRVAAALIVV